MAELEERDNFTIGERASITKEITMEDIAAYAELVGDDNPIHLDASYAEKTRFGGRIAHGMLVAGLISAVLGNKLPGAGAIYMSQELKFRAPVRPGDTVTASAEVVDWDPEKGRITLSTDVTNQEDVVVLLGEARLVMSGFLK